MSYRGLILDFGGVVTTDLYAEMSAFCVREGLAHDAVVRVLRDTAEGREASWPTSQSPGLPILAHGATSRDTRRAV
jgi:hypothetical protein